jgi:hypothetical protein
MWTVTTNAIDWEIFPGEELALIHAKIDELAAAGFTDPVYIIPPTPLPDGHQQRQRNFTTLASAQDYANFINELPSDLVNVISIVEVV